MRIEKLKNGTTIELYESIEELPLKRFHKYNKFILIDSGIGSDLNDINGHISRTEQMISHDPRMALKELENLRQCIFLIVNETSPRHLAFAALIHSVNGKVVTDISDEGLKRVLDMVNKANVGWVDKLFDSAKKKISSEINVYFKTDDSKLIEFYELLLKKSRLQIQEVLTDTDQQKRITPIEKDLLYLTAPKSFSGGHSVEVLFDKRFENNCILLRKELSIDPNIITAFEYLTALDTLNEMAREARRELAKDNRHGRQ